MSSPPTLTELYVTHAAPIAALRADLGASLPPSWDELWLLRFCLSFPDGAARLAAARSCIEWRAANAAMLATVAAGQRLPSHAVIEQYVVTGLHGASRFGEPLFIVRAGLSNPVEVMNAVSSEALVEHLMADRERVFRICDAETRKRNVITKMITVIHMANSQLALMDRRYFAVLSQSGKLSEVVYPQLLLRSVGVNPPAFFHAVFALMRPLLSAKMIEKQSLCSGPSSARPSASACPFASARFDVATLPSFLGGACKCTARGGCIGCRPNEETRPAPIGGPVERVVPIGARSHVDVLLGARAAGGTLRYDFAIEAMGLEVSAWLTPDAGPDVPLLALQKYKAGGHVTGAISIPAAGTVTMRFSNAHSILTGKTVVVTARIEDAAEGGKADDAPRPAAADAAAAHAL